MKMRLICVRSIVMGIVVLKLSMVTVIMMKRVHFMVTVIMIHIHSMVLVIVIHIPSRLFMIHIRSTVIHRRQQTPSPLCTIPTLHLHPRRPSPPQTPSYGKIPRGPCTRINSGRIKSTENASIKLVPRLILVLELTQLQSSRLLQSIQSKRLFSRQPAPQHRIPRRTPPLRMSLPLPLPHLPLLLHFCAAYVDHS